MSSDNSPDVLAAQDLLSTTGAVGANLHITCTCKGLSEAFALDWDPDRGLLQDSFENLGGGL